jgi:hypothetical protein
VLLLTTGLLPLLLLIKLHCMICTLLLLLPLHFLLLLLLPAQ